MKTIRSIALLLSAAILIALCSFGCAANPPAETTASAPESEPSPTLTEVPTAVPTEAPTSVPTEAPTAVPTEAPTEAPEIDEPDGIPVRRRNGGRLSFLPGETIEIPPLSEMVYTRPDADSLIGDLEALTDKVADCDDAEILLNDYFAVLPRIHSFESMLDLAFFRYTMNTDDSYYTEEYDFCDEQGTIVNDKEHTLYAAFAASPCRDALEQSYFGEGFFKDYDDFNTTDDSFYDLTKQENDLLFQYYDVSGAAGLYSRTQIEKNHDVLGTLFIELVKTRGQIAAAKGYDNYMDYIYATEYQRDYSTAQAREYLEAVKTLLAPLMRNRKIADDYAYYSNWNESRSMEILSSAAEKMGGPIWEAFRFLSGREMFDISHSSNKLGIAYTSYLGDYEAPFIFVNPDANDLLISLFHEFGHFTDFYCNYGLLGDYETGETYSQSMQYLAFAYADSFTDSQREKNLRATISDLLVYSVLREGAYADFELQVYSLAPEELTLDRLDAVFEQCMTDYGLHYVDGISFDGIYWVAYNHFYAYPGYVISYSTSAVSALQIIRMEAEEPGAGVEAFCRLLERTHGKKFAAVLAEAELDSPFEEATLQKTAEFLKIVFSMN